MDPLLAACFASQAWRRKSARGVDLGTGCGVLALAMLLDNPGLSMAGVELSRDMAAHARENAARLGLNDRFEVVEGDVAELRSLAAPESFDFATANPPYREQGRGRTGPDPSRNSARFEGEAGLRAFVQAGAFAVRNSGLMVLVYPADRLADLLGAMVEARLEPKRLRMVHSRLDEPARLVLVEGRKNGGRELRVEPPLALYEGRGQETRLTAQALEFCPFLACNP